MRAVRLQVIDNGHGFADKVLKRAFEPYVTTKARAPAWAWPWSRRSPTTHGARIRIANLGWRAGRRRRRHCRAPGAAAVTGRKFRYHFPSSLRPTAQPAVAAATASRTH